MKLHFPALGAKPTQDEVESMGDACVDSFAEFLGTRLKTFKKHLVDDGSYVGHCYGEYIVNGKVILAIEVVMLLGLRPVGTPPAICSEVLHFIRGRRVGFQDCRGLSYINYLYDVHRGWIENGDEIDCVEEWAKIRSPRFDPQQSLSVTYDGWSLKQPRGDN